MRVLVVTTWFPSAGEPTKAPFNLQHVKAISLTNEVRVIHVRLGRPRATVTEHYEGVTVRRVSLSPRRPLSVLAAWRSIRGALRHADVLHTMAFSSALVTAPAHALTGRPWVHTEHWSGVSNPANVGGAWPRMAWLRQVLRLPHRLTGVTTQLTDVLARFGRAGAASVIPCVVENSAPLTQPLFGDPLQLVAVGGLIEGKRPLMAVRTLHWLRSQGRAAHLTWVGGGELAGVARQLALDLGVDDALTLTGSLPPVEVLDRLAAADLFFLPTAHENFLTSAAEALSAGRAVVVPAVGGYTDYVNASNGVFVHKNTPEAYGRGILEATERFAGVDAHELAEPIRARFSMQTVGSEFDRIYAELAAGRRRPGGARTPYRSDTSQAAERTDG